MTVAKVRRTLSDVKQNDDVGTPENEKVISVAGLVKA